LADADVMGNFIFKSTALPTGFATSNTGCLDLNNLYAKNETGSLKIFNQNSR
jgi:hypothetical protein